MERKESEVKKFTCLRCGINYTQKKGTLKNLEFCKYRITIEDVEYYECEKCGRLLFPMETAEKIEKEFSRVKKEEGCKACYYFSSDNDRDTVWYICTHDEILKHFPDGRVLSPDFKIPSWCPLLKGVKT